MVGAQGRLGACVVETFANREVVAHTRATLDVTNPDAVRLVVADVAPALIVNCSAFNDVDAAEARPLEALAVNAFAVRSLARAARDTGATLVHYSTDFVFDGAASSPYDEDASPSPRSTYAASKLLGEWFALDLSSAFVLRVESLFGSAGGWSGRRSTLDGIVDALRSGREQKVFTDRVVSPSYAPDIAAATRHLLESGATPGIYHCVNTGHASWHDVALEAAAVLGVDHKLVPVTMEQVPMAASRPRFCALANRKLAAAGFTMPTWQHALRRWLQGRQASIRGVNG